MAGAAVAVATCEDVRVHDAGKKSTCGLTVYSGLMGSGKTTAARNSKEQNKTAWLISRDDFRNAMFQGPDQFPQEEEVITTILLQLARLGLGMGYDVIVDDVNIFPEEKCRWNTLAKELNVPIHWHSMATDLEECIRRDSLRPKSVGRATIEEYALAAGLLPLRTAHRGWEGLPEPASCCADSSALRSPQSIQPSVLQGASE